MREIVRFPRASHIILCVILCYVMLCYVVILCYVMHFQVFDGFCVCGCVGVCVCVGEGGGAQVSTWQFPGSPDCGVERSPDCHGDD